jgi:hypothetical protein
MPNPIQEASARYERLRALWYSTEDGSAEEALIHDLMREAFEDEIAARTAARRARVETSASTNVPHDPVPA